MKKINIILSILLLSFILSSCSNETGKVVNGYTQIGNLKLEQVQMPEEGL